MAKDLKKALEYLDQAIVMDEENPLLFSNRAQVHIDLEDFESGLKDAESAISFKPDFTRVYYRKACC